MLFEEFARRYFPGPLPEGQVDAKTAKEHADLMTGCYVLSRRAHESFLSLAELLGHVKVLANTDGTLEMPLLKGPGEAPKKWREIAPFVWRNVDGGDRLAAKVENGRVTRFGVDEFPFMLFEPVGWWWSSAWLLPLWIASLVVLALTALAWPVSALVRRYYGAAYGLTGVEARAHRTVRIASVLVVGITIAWIVFLQMMQNDSGSLTSPGSDILVSSLRLLSFAVFVAGAAIALWNAWAVLRSSRRWLAKAWSVVLALSCLTVLYVGILFHLVGYSANY